MGIGEHHVHGLVLVQSQPICRLVSLPVFSFLPPIDSNRSTINFAYFTSPTSVACFVELAADRPDKPPVGCMVVQWLPHCLSGRRGAGLITYAAMCWPSGGYRLPRGGWVRKRQSNPTQRGSVQQIYFGQQQQRASSLVLFNFQNCM